MIRVNVTADVHHLYVTFQVPAWKHYEATRDLRGMGARYQPASARWAVPNTQAWHRRLEDWATTFFPDPAWVAWLELPAGIG